MNRDLNHLRRRYSLKNKDALLFLLQGAEDYVAARYLINYGFIDRGLTDIAQAVEKTGKALILLSGKEVQGIRHNFEELFQRIKLVTEGKVSISIDCAHQLKYFFLSRYPDTMLKEEYRRKDSGGFGKSTKDMEWIDEIMEKLYLEIKCHLPVYIRNRVGIWALMDIGKPFMDYRSILWQNNRHLGYLFEP